MNRDGVKDWFLLNAPKRSHKGLAVSATITCQHICSLLSKKNLFLSFDDTNGIGTARYLLEQALSNTGWTLKYCETFYEADGVTEKVRSLKSENKRGAYLLISDICKLFIVLLGMGNFINPMIFLKVQVFLKAQIYHSRGILVILDVQGYISNFESVGGVFGLF